MSPKPVIPEDLATMGHLKADILQEEATKAIDPPTKLSIPENDPKLKKDYIFQFKWSDGRGKEWAGEFTNHVLDIRERQMVGLMQSKFNGGMPHDSIDPDIKALNMVIAHMTYSLGKDRPEWAKDLQSLLDMQLIQALWLEVQTHEDTFRGWKAPSAGGDTKA